jgi:transcription elongation GreA/GreB family factor
MPLAVKPLPHAYADAGEEEILTAEARLAQFVRAEIDRALRDVDRRKRLAEMDLARHARRATHRIETTGHRLERSLRRAPLPVVPVAIGAAIIAGAWFFSRRN